MPTKRRRRRRKQRRNADTSVVEDLHSGQASSNTTEQTTGCSVCHRSDKPVFGCPPHTICELCLKDADTSDLNSLQYPLCPDELSSKVGVVIKKVKHLWLSAPNCKQTNTSDQFCTVHANQTVEFLCQKCEVLVCPLCKLAEHEGHDTKSLQFVMAEARQRVADASKTRLRDFHDRLQTAIEENKKSGESFRRHGKEVEKTIHSRHALLLDMIDKYRDSALLELEAMTVDVESCLEEDEVRLRNELDALSGLQSRIDHSTADTDPSGLFLVDRKITAEWSQDRIMARRATAFPSYTYKMEHDSTSTTASKPYASSGDDKLEKFVDCIIGHPVVNKTHLPKGSLDVKVTPVFRCCEDPGALVLSVCPTGAKKVAVSYSTSSDYKDGVTKSFFEDGRPSKSFDFGLCTLRREGNGIMWPMKYNCIKSFGLCLRAMMSKSGNRCSLLYNQDAGYFLFSFFSLPSPFSKIFNRALPSTLFPSSFCDAVAPLNFDVTRRGDVVAIVDVKNGNASPLENNLKNSSRVVKMISLCENFSFTDVYEPPLPGFVPSDVCFFTLEGRTVLLVSDLGTNSIHVLSIEPFFLEQKVINRCCFQRYLVADCEMLKQPTALNTDEKGRLWVACKGGQLLTVEPVQ